MKCKVCDTPLGERDTCRAAVIYTVWGHSVNLSETMWELEGICHNCATVKLRNHYEQVFDPEARGHEDE